MVGDHGTAFIASAYQKGIRDYDIQQARCAKMHLISTTEAYKDDVQKITGIIPAIRLLPVGR